MEKMKLNPDKTLVLWVSRKADGELEITPVLDGVTLSLRSQVPSSRMLFNTHVSLGNQATAVV